MLKKNILRRTCLHKQLQNICHLRIIDARCQLTVGKSSGSALAKLHVRRRVEVAGAPEALHILHALCHRLAALQQKRLIAMLRQLQSCQKSRRTCADNHRRCAQRQRTHNKLRRCLLLIFADVPIGQQALRLPAIRLNISQHVIIKANILLLTCVHSLTQNLHTAQHLSGNPRLFADSLLQTLLMQQADAHIINFQLHRLLNSAFLPKSLPAPCAAQE